MIPIWQSEVISDLSEVVKGNLYPAREQWVSNWNINYLNGQAYIQAYRGHRHREKGISSIELSVILSEHAMQIQRYITFKYLNMFYIMIWGYI